ncbi:hypothetical protein ACRJ4B_14630 [Streptomyces sp. GTA36]
MKIQKEELKMGTNVQVDSASAKCTQTMSGALMLIESLKKEKVEMILSYPGGAVLPIYDKLYNSGVTYPSPTHKAPFMQQKDTREFLENQGRYCDIRTGSDKPLLLDLRMP